MEASWKKQFFILYIGQAFSLLGSAAVQFAVIWWLTVETESAITLTLASLISLAPNVLIAPFAGVLIDRFNRRTVMIAADGLIALSSAVLGAIFLLLPTPPVRLIYAVLFIRGVGNTFHSPAMQAAIPLLVPAEMLTKAGGWGGLVTSLSTMLGPVLGAALMDFFSIESIMLVDIIGACFAILLLLLINIPDTPQAAVVPNFAADFNQGFAAMRDNRPLMAALLPLVLATVIYMPLGALFPLLVRSHFMGEAWHNSVVELVFSAGLLVSSVIMGMWGGLRRRFLMVSLGIGLLGAATLVSGALPRSGYWAFVVCCFFMGGSGTLFNVPLMAHIQESTPPEVMGKVFSLLITIMTLATPIGLLLAGPATAKVGPGKWFLLSGVAMLCAAVICFVRTYKYDTPAPRDDGGE